jgi:chromosome segregation protein
VRPPTEVAVAVRAALGAFAEGFGLGSAEAVQHAADQIGDGEEGPAAAILSLGESSARPRFDPPAADGIVGNAARLAGASDHFRGAIDALLGRTLIVRDRAAARRVLPQLPDDARLVTLRGDVFYPDGHVVVNAGRPYRSRRDVRERLGQDLEAARARVADSEREEETLRAGLAAATSEVTQAQEALRLARAGEQRNQGLAAEALALERAQSGEVAFVEERLREAEQRLAGALARTAAETEGGAALEAEQKSLERIVRLEDVRQGGEAAAAHLARAESSVQTARVWLDEASERLAEIEQMSTAQQAEREQMGARLSALRAEQANLSAGIARSQEAELGVETRLAALEADSRPAEESLTAAEEERSVLERRESQLRAEVQAAERRHSQTQIEWARRQEEQASLRRRAEDDFGLVAFDLDDSGESQVPIPFEGLVEHLPRVEELPIEYESQVARLRLQLRRMGAVNPEAQKEYQEVRERVDFLTAQVEDLDQAESQLQGVIAELDVQMESEFQKTFEAVAREFRETFTRLFGGGSVRLTLTDPGDLSQTGIDIEARLPGRREQGLAMLSGGERSLTACALVFALLKVSPTPFCVLDEVDAMLDESNVARFREMLRELSGQTQFVIITHNRQTVQAAEVLYGVSMGPDSASAISLQLDEAERGLEV